MGLDMVRGGLVLDQQVSGLLRTDRLGPVVVLVLANPPVNTLTEPLELALAAALDSVAADPAVHAVILRGEGRGFSAGADIREAGQVARMAAFAALCRKIEDFPKPVIAALHGTALGAGCALAMAAHYRIANAGAMMGLPEVGLGLLPGGGATQRLPRLVGVDHALRLMLTGLPIRAAEALAIGLIDRVVTENLGEAALAMADGLPPRPTRAITSRDVARFPVAVAEARAQDRGNPMPAPGRIIDCIESAALLPFEMGLTVETTAFEDLSATPEAHGLRHAFLAERRALQPPAEIAGRQWPTLTTIGILGAVEPAADMALQALEAGLHVTIVEPDRALLAEALSRIAARQEQAVASKRITEEARDEAWGRLSTSLVPVVLSDADLVLLPPGQMPLSDPLPQAVMGAVGQGAGMTVPDAAGGLAELSIGAGADPDIILRLSALARRLNWRAVTVGPGGPVELGLRLALDAAEQFLLQSHPAELVSAALAAYGFGQPHARHLPPMPKGGKALIQICLAALAAEGARMLSDGRARRPCDIDAVALISGLMPRWHGGPMFLADQRGLLVLRADLRKLEAEVFAVAPLIDDLVADGRKFASLDGV